MTWRDIRLFDGTINQIQGFRVDDAFVAAKNGYGTVYVRPTLKMDRARRAYKLASGRELRFTGHDLDHLFPKSLAKEVDASAIAVGDIPLQINRSHGNRGDRNDYALKAVGLKSTEVNRFVVAGPATAKQIGLALKNGYLFQI